MVSSSLVTGSIAAHTQWGERDRRVKASTSLTSPAFTALSSAKSSSSWTCVTRTSCKKDWEKAVAWSHLDQPREHRIGVHLEHAGHGTNAQALRQRAHRPHQHVERNALAMQRGAVRVLEIFLAGDTLQLPPGSAIRMAIGADIAQAAPAIIRTGRIWAVLLLRIHRARTATRACEQRWWGYGGWLAGFRGMLARFTKGLISEP